MWEKLGSPSKESKFCRPKFKPTKPPTGLNVENSHSSILEILSNALKIIPTERMSASELLQLPFWNEEPDEISKSNANDWLREISKEFKKEPQSSNSFETFTKQQIIMHKPLDTCFIESDLLWANSALKNLNQQHLQMIVRIALKASWSQEIFEECVLITDRTLNCGNFLPTSISVLICSTAYVTCCLHSDLEPSPLQLKVWSECSLSLSHIYRGVYCVLAAMNFRLLPSEICKMVKTLPEWEKIKYF